MKYSQQILNLAQQNNGIITTEMVVAAGISRGSLKHLVDSGELERASRGVYTLRGGGKMNLSIFKAVINGGFFLSTQHYSCVI